MGRGEWSRVARLRQNEQVIGSSSPCLDGFAFLADKFPSLSLCSIYNYYIYTVSSVRSNVRRSIFLQSLFSRLTFPCSLPPNQTRSVQTVSPVSVCRLLCRCRQDGDSVFARCKQTSMSPLRTQEAVFSPPHRTALHWLLFSSRVALSTL